MPAPSAMSPQSLTILPDPARMLRPGAATLGAFGGALHLVDRGPGVLVHLAPPRLGREARRRLGVVDGHLPLLVRLALVDDLPRLGELRAQLLGARVRSGGRGQLRGS